jgi:hypothetical protein
MASPQKRVFSPTHPRCSFIVRLWQTAQLSGWVVEVQVVQSGALLHTDSIDKLPDLLRAQIQPEQAPGLKSQDDESSNDSLPSRATDLCL